MYRGSVGLQTIDIKTVDSAIELLESSAESGDIVGAPAMSLRQAIAKAYPAITKMRKKGYQWDKIVQVLEEGGIHISLTTLRQYYRDVTPESERVRRRVKAKVKAKTPQKKERKKSYMETAPFPGPQPVVTAEIME